MTTPVHDGCTSGREQPAHGIPVFFRIRELARVAGAAASAVMVCFPLLLAARPKTPLRVFCIAAFEYLARLQGSALGKRRRLAMAHACDFGSLRDDYYDRRRLDASEYRTLRSELRWIAPEAATARYIRELREAERGRPVLSATDRGVVNAVIAYRTSVLDLSLRWMQEISGLSVEAAQFRVLLDLVSLMQVADDVLDWKEDQAERCPSYVTAFLLDRMERPNTGVAKPLRAEADALLRRLVAEAKQNAGAMPFTVAGVLTWTLVVTLLKVRFPQ